MSVVATIVGLGALAATAWLGNGDHPRSGIRRPSLPPPGRRMPPPARRGRVRPHRRPGRPGWSARTGGSGRPRRWPMATFRTGPARSRRDRLGDGSRWSGRGDLALLDGGPVRAGGPPGRLVLGRAGRRLVVAEPRQSVIVFGPTQSRKTSGFAVPAILRWQGPVVAASVKTDLVRDTVDWRRRQGNVWCIDPTGTTGLAATSWSPLPASATWPGARRMAAALAEGGRQRAGTMEDAAFWYAAAAKLLAPLLFAAATGARPLDDVLRWLDTHEEGEVLDLLEATGVDAAVRAAIASFARDERQRSSIYTTAETVMEPFGDALSPGSPPPGPAGDAGAPFDPALLVSGANTAYLCAPAHDQRRLAPLFVAAVRQVVEHVYDTVAATGRPLDPPLLVVLDEAANIAPLDDLDGLASTAAGHGIQLVTVWHDLAQLSARYGSRAPTVVNNHRAKVYLAGISDPSTLEHASTLAGEAWTTESSTTSGGPGGPTRTDALARRPLVTPDGLRRIAPGEGLLIYGGLPPAHLTLQSWFEDPVLAARGRRHD